MAQLALRALRGWARTPHATRIAVIYLGARVVTTVFLLIAASQSTSLSRFGAQPGLGAFVLGWDAQWYWSVAVYGYPTTLPLTDGGEVAENTWAFMPLYAYASEILGALFGSWASGALIISLVSGYLACLVLHRLLRRRLGCSAATWAVILFASSPLAAMFQVAYAESLFLMLLFLALETVATRRYAWLYALIPLLAFTRPGVLAFALFLGLHGIVRLVRRREEPLLTSHVVHIIAAGALATLCGFSWQAIAAMATGDPGAYLATELAWRRHWVAGGVDAFVPFEGWVQAAQFWFAQWGMPADWGVAALVLLVVGAAAVLVRAKPVRALGADIRLWSASYLLYLLAVFFPQSSTFRLLLPLSPLWGAFAVPRSRWWRLGVLGACLVGQAVWIHAVYALGNTFWQVP
ncbi:hypothetical protein [Microbacterium sp.]|uniref:hypothetical protein n=1 Tax=Microbacterium sp. TaxID=51671 RepID=UPI0039E4D141